jgi:hypothetical protein
MQDNVTETVLQLKDIFTADGVIPYLALSAMQEGLTGVVQTSDPAGYNPVSPKSLCI